MNRILNNKLINFLLLCTLLIKQCYTNCSLNKCLGTIDLKKANRKKRNRILNHQLIIFRDIVNVSKCFNAIDSNKYPGPLKLSTAVIYVFS